MVVTVTFNPALDYIVYLPSFETGGLNRTEKESIVPGGKGINVSVVLAHLGIPNRALGFVAGFTGEEICRRLQQAGCEADFIRIPDGFSRINVKIKGNEETEINGQGPKIEEAQLRQLTQQLSELTSGDYLVLAGSIPKTLPENLYQQILKPLSQRGVNCVVDATGELLRSVLPYRPFLVKPNHHELGELFGETLCSDEDISRCAHQVQQMGARNVLVSMAGDGAYLLTESGEEYRLPAPSGRVVNSVGAGDSMVAGFLAGWIQTGAYESAFRLGVASGSATAFKEWLAEREEVDAILQKMEENH